MARLARIEYHGAIYHVINRGNYRRDVFDSAGSAGAFVAVLEEAVKRYEWELGAYVIMRNHFHLAVRTPHANLSSGMQWLQVSFAARFNRFRSENGHLFQGRFKSFLLQDEHVWARVADYIHLNPLRAKLVPPEHLASFRWSSLMRFIQHKGFAGLDASPWLGTLGLHDTSVGWGEYTRHLLDLHRAEESLPIDERESLSSGWAIGTDEWKSSLLDQRPKGITKAEYHEPKEVQRLRWQRRLEELLAQGGYSRADLNHGPRHPEWKVRLANHLQREMGVPVVWLASALHWRSPAALRTRLCRFRRSVTLSRHDPFV
jgi:putative transposase